MDDKEEIHLTYEDIIPYLPPDITDIDQSPDIIQYLRDWKEKTQRRYVSRINYLYDQFQAVWPSGTPIDYYIAYVHFSSKSEDELFDKLQDTNTIKEILKIVASKKENNSTFSNEKSKLSNVENDDIDNDIYDDDTQVSKKKKKKSYWTETEISSFIKLLSEKNNLKTWKNVSNLFKNKTKDDCYQLYQKLHEKGQLSSKYVPKKDVISKRSTENDEDNSTFKDVKGLFLEFNNIHSIVGPNLETRKEIARYSPLYGHTDLITGERMFLPTISEYGTVLDYSSWLKIISETHLDPIAIKPIHNVRQITIITCENYEEIKEQIKHVGSQKNDKNE